MRSQAVVGAAQQQQVVDAGEEQHGLALAGRGVQEQRSQRHVAAMPAAMASYSGARGLALRANSANSAVISRAVTTHCRMHSAAGSSHGYANHW